MSAVEISVREANIEDVDVLAHIGSSSFREAYEDHSAANDLETHIGKYFTVAAVRNEIEKNGCRYLLAIVDGAQLQVVRLRVLVKHVGPQCRFAATHHQRVNGQRT